MGVPNSEDCYIPAMPGREGHEVHKDMWGIGPKKIVLESGVMSNEVPLVSKSLRKKWFYTFHTAIFPEQRSRECDLRAK